MPRSRPSPQMGSSRDAASPPTPTGSDDHPSPVTTHRDIPSVARLFAADTTRQPREVVADAIVFGGGVTGLWILDDLTRAGLRVVLFEADALGRGQTVGSQGIIHGGAKYALDGVLSRAAVAIREMPVLWRTCLEGRDQPDLQPVARRAEGCFLWHTGSIRSRLGWLGAHLGLRVAPEGVPDDALPGILRDFAGAVAWMPEPVVDPRSLLDVLRSRHHTRILSIVPGSISNVCVRSNGVRFGVSAGTASGTAVQLHVRAGSVVLAAGTGNARLRQRFGLSKPLMQRRPLRMVALRGPLPEFCGHCVDGATTRVTITSQRVDEATVVWQIGGRLAERGATMNPGDLLPLTVQELGAVLPRLDLQHVEATTYVAVRAERATPGRRRPSRPAVLAEGPVITVWPTKLAFAPLAAAEVRRRVAVRAREPAATGECDPLDDLPRPNVASFPWDAGNQWTSLGRYTRDGAAFRSRRRAG